MSDSESRPSRTESKPRLAATAIVLREHENEVQVLMTRRHAALAFMGGMWVFPGGTLTEADRSNAARELLPSSGSFVLRDIEGNALPQDLSIALAVAAIRETYEEAGILFARRKDGQWPSSEQLRRLQADRARLTTDPALFIDALAQEELILGVDRLIYWAHWITPSGLPRRFDTRFFVARAPEQHDLIADAHETAECLWASPKKLIERAARGEMKIPQPTLYTLEDLRSSIERHRTLDALMSTESGREVAAIMPKMFDADGQTIIVMPWDPSYPSLPGEGVRTDQSFEPALLALPGRIERDH
jgi:8-oxo-dGTP pyrophosphatase MutT (NUDIX family)